MPKQLTIVGGSVNTSMVTATAGDVLMGKDFVDSTGAIINGTIFAHDMAYLNEQYADEENGVQSTTESGTSFTIQQGYYGSNLSIPIKPLDLSTITVGNVVAGDIRSGKIAWVNGEQVVGTMVEKLGTRSLSLGGSTSIPAGQTGTWNFSCYVEKIKVTTAPLSEQTVGTATADDIIIGKTAWVNGELVTGTMKDYTSQYPAGTNVLPLDGTTLYIKKGYYGNSFGVRGRTLVDSTVGTATAADILTGKTAWVNGEEITGTYSPIKMYGEDEGILVPETRVTDITDNTIYRLNTKDVTFGPNESKGSIVRFRFYCELSNSDSLKFNIDIIHYIPSYQELLDRYQYDRISTASNAVSAPKTYITFKANIGFSPDSENKAPMIRFTVDIKTNNSILSGDYAQTGAIVKVSAKKIIDLF